MRFNASFFLLMGTSVMQTQNIRQVGNNCGTWHVNYIFCNKFLTLIPFSKYLSVPVVNFNPLLPSSDQSYKEDGTSTP